MNRPGEKTFKGLAVSPGIGFGRAYLLEGGLRDVPEYCIPEHRIKDELGRLEKALEVSRDQLATLKAKSMTLPPAASEELGYLLEAHIHMLKGSRLVRGIEIYIQNHAINAEAAVQHVLDEITEGFKALDDAYIASRQTDVHQVAARLVRNLHQSPEPTLQNLPKGSVIIAEELTPADTAQMSPDLVSGICTALGAPDSHTAIMARALGLPAVLGVTELIGSIAGGDEIIVDGDHGQVILNPTPDTRARYENRSEENRKRLKVLEGLSDKPAITKDGIRINMFANVELPMEVDMIKRHGGEGIGLLRSEFMYMNRSALPGEEDQYQEIRTLIEAMDQRLITVRTLDIGGDKTNKSLIEDFGNSISSPLGMRGIRLSLNLPDILETQFRAILRASCHGPVRILLPMVTSVDDVRQSRRILHTVARKMRSEGYDLPKYLPHLGAMIEVPGAALAADALAQVCDFFAIGSNDLTMYTLATDRADDQVAHLYDPLHPAVLRLIQFTTQAARRAGIDVSVCGEIAGNPAFTPLLIGLGLRDLSMSAPNIPKVKERIRSLNAEQAKEQANLIMQQTDRARIELLLDDPLLRAKTKRN